MKKTGGRGDVVVGRGRTASGAWADATCETTNFTMWKSEVVGAACKMGADPYRCRVYERLPLWFRAGEPVWMAAETLAFAVLEGARQTRIDEETEADAAGLRACVRAGLRAGRKEVA